MDFFIFIPHRLLLVDGTIKTNRSREAERNVVVEFSRIHNPIRSFPLDSVAFLEFNVKVEILCVIQWTGSLFEEGKIALLCRN